MSRTAVVAWMISGVGWMLIVVGLTLVSSPWNWVLFAAGAITAGLALVLTRSSRHETQTDSATRRRSDTG